MRLSVQEKQAIRKALRQGLYIVLIIAAIYIMHFITNFLKGATFAEDCGIEIGQFTILLCTAILFYIRAKTYNEIKHICLLCSALCILACFRESDKILDAAIPLLSWKIGYVFPLIAVGYSVKNIRNTIKELVLFINSPVFLMCCYAIVICLIGQLIGHAPFIRNVLYYMDKTEITDIKELFEESVETIAYLTLCLASIENFFIKEKIPRV